MANFHWEQPGKQKTEEKPHKRRLGMRDWMRMHARINRYIKILQQSKRIISKENDWKKIARNYMMIKYGLRAQTHTYAIRTHFAVCNYRPGLKLVCEILRAALSLTHTYTHTGTLWCFISHFDAKFTFDLTNEMNRNEVEKNRINFQQMPNKWMEHIEPEQAISRKWHKNTTQIGLRFFFFSSSCDGTIAASIRFSFYLFVCLSRAWINDWMWFSLLMMMMVSFFWCWAEQWKSECGCFQTIFAFISNSNSFQLNV